MRQWVPQTQHNIDQLVLEVLKRGAHPDDRDSLTDMTLLMYSCKAGASGVGNVEAAVKVLIGHDIKINISISIDSDHNLPCRARV